MLIGISGKMGSGKNLVCTIIQGLTAAKKHNIENPSFEWIKKYYINSIWEQKAFAGKLKQTASLLTGIPVEKFEDQDFKNKELGEEWWYYKGKNGSLIPFNGDSKRSSEDLIKLTPRLLLQLLGTECGRQIIHPNVWVNALMSEYKTKSTLVSEVNYLGDSRCGICKKPTKDISYFLCDEHVEKSKNNFPNWIITDMRFPNEMEAVKKKDGITIRVNRNLEESKDQHESETELDNAEFDYVIDNNGTIEELIEKVKEILIKEKLI